MCNCCLWHDQSPYRETIIFWASIISNPEGFEMNHPDRIFCIKGIDTENDLVEVMTNHKWPLCQAFDHNGFFYLNDGDKESEPEYSVMKID